MCNVKTLALRENRFIHDIMRISLYILRHPVSKGSNWLMTGKLLYQ